MTPEQSVIASWAARELAPWRNRKLNRAHAEARFAKLSQGALVTFVFRIADGHVTIDPKPNHVDNPGYPGFLNRAHRYRKHFQDAVDLHCPDLDITLCASMDDKPRNDTVVPTFAFQKAVGEPAVLFPDIDMLSTDFYEGDGFRDLLAYDEKRIRAFFIGSLTGGLVTPETILAQSLPRLEAAASFHGDPDVEFRVPLRGQIASDEAARMLAALPYCGGDVASWSEQLQNRFLISMDGNGATCSRVAIALKSNSVLLKYASAQMLYYFSGLSAWTHFIPIDRHDDVRKIIALERHAPGWFAPVALAGRHFAESFLSRERANFYTGTLLSLYETCFAGAGSNGGTPRRPGAAWTVLVHVRAVGDCRGTAGMWLGSPSSAHCMEGFSLMHVGGAGHDGLRYCGVLADGSRTAWTQAGVFCGTRGRNQPLAGLCIDLQGPAREKLDLRYEARFVDGTLSPLVCGGDICVSPRGVPMAAIRLVIKPRKSGS